MSEVQKVGPKVLWLGTHSPMRAALNLWDLTALIASSDLENQKGHAGREKHYAYYRLGGRSPIEARRRQQTAEYDQN
jgi:hypothetical protein